MALLELWNANKAAFGSLNVEQIVAMAGDGNLKDDSPCCKELRQYLQLLPLEILADHVERCLTYSFASGGLVLQDLVNEIGRRLDYSVTNGRYRGVPGQIGFDGIWKSPEGQSIVIEAKTTDAYRIKLDTIAAYRTSLATKGELTLGSISSILIVVGRTDTGELEAQVRGSRHAWDVRIISIDSLLKLASLKQDTNDPETAEKIRALLVPVDYTRLDGIIDIMFTAAVDVAEGEGETPESGDADEPEETVTITGRSGVEAIESKRIELLTMMSTRLGAQLIKKSRATFWDASHQKRSLLCVSKPYHTSIHRYWYAHHPSWEAFLDGGTDSFVVLGATDQNAAFVLPHGELHSKLSLLNQTTKPNGKSYWHIKIVEKTPGTYFLKLPKAADDWPLAAYRVNLDLLAVG